MFKRLLRQVLLAPVVLVLLFEEWGWAPLAALVARLGRLPLWGWVERRIAGLPPYAALLIFALPTLALLPVKLLALYLLGMGKTKLALTVLISAKLLGTAVLARLFQLIQPGLMQLAWFARWYPRWKSWKDGVLSLVHACAPWRMAREFKAQTKAWWMRARS